jgi:hypothetical protein
MVGGAVPALHTLCQGSPAVATDPSKFKSQLAGLALLPTASVSLRDGEVVVFRNRHSPIWQCRYKLRDGSWIRAGRDCGAR